MINTSKFQIQLEPVSLEFIDDDMAITIVIYVDDIIIYEITNTLAISFSLMPCLLS